MIALYNRLPAATKLLLQSFFAVLGSVLSGVVTAEYQNITSAGHLNVSVQINVALATFALLFGKAMQDWIPAHAQQLIQSIQAEQAALVDALQRSQAVTHTQVPSSPPALPHVVVQPAIVPALKTEDITSIAAQLAINLMNMAAQRATQAVASTVPAQPTTSVPPAQSAQPPYVDPLRYSAVLPDYSPPAPISDLTTHSVPAA